MTTNRNAFDALEKIPAGAELSDGDVLDIEVLERAVRVHLLVKRSVKHLFLIARRETAQSASSEQIRELIESLVIGPLLNRPAGEPDTAHP